MKKSVIAFMALAVAVAFTACNNTVEDSSTSLDITSLAAPVVQAKAYPGWNYVTWNPVLNATGYRLYRYVNKNDGYGSIADPEWTVKNVSYTANLWNADAVTHENQLVNDAVYTYYVVATGVQSARSVGIVLTADDILGDSVGSASCKATIPAMYTAIGTAPLTAISDSKAVYTTDKNNNPYVLFSYTKPNYNYGTSVKFARQSTGIDGISDYEYFNWTANFADTCSASAANYVFNYTLPAWGGNYKYTLYSEWNPDADYYTYASTEGTFAVPDAGKTLPAVTAVPAGKKGMKITFTDDYNATYTLYKANKTDYAFTALAVTPEKVTTTDANGIHYAYTYYDTDVTIGTTYVYALAGKIGTASLEYGTNCVVDKEFTGTLAWNPQFAAFNSNGNVSLSWNNEAGITYSVIRKESVNNTETTLAVTGVTTVNGVSYMTDTITKLTTAGAYYTYELVGVNAVGSYDIDSNNVSYAVSNPTFTLAYSTVTDTNENGLADGVVLTLTADSSIDVSTVSFFRALAANDDKGTSIDDGYYEFNSKYETVTLTKAASTSVSGTDTVYTYTDSSLTEAQLAADDYAYAAAVTVDGVALSDAAVYKLPETKPTFADITVTAKAMDVVAGSSSKLVVGWNTQYKDSYTATNAAKADIAKQAAVITMQTAYSNAVDVASVAASEWTDVTPNLTDGTYTYTNDAVKDHTAYEYYWYRITYTNMAGSAVSSGAITNQGWVSTATDQGISGIAAGTIYTDTTDITKSSHVIYFVTKGGKDVALSNYKVFETPVAADGILGAPNEVSSDSLKKVLDVKNGTTSLNAFVYGGSWDTTGNNPAYYFGNAYQTYSAAKPYVLVHVVDANGFVFRALITNW